MSDRKSEEQKEFDFISTRLSALEERIQKIERRIGIFQVSVDDEPVLSDSESSPTGAIQGDSLLESKVGGYGLSLLGSTVLLLGIIFISQLIQSNGHPLLSGIFGYLSVGGFFSVGIFLSRRGIGQMAGMFHVIGLLLLYYVTLRLHFFSATPQIDGHYTGLTLTGCVILIQAYLAIRKKSELYAAVAILFALVTAYVSRNTYIILPALVLIGAASVYSLFRYHWMRLFMATLMLVYAAYTLWFMDAYLAAGQHGQVPSHQYCHIYLFLSAFIFSLVAFLSKKEGIPLNFLFASIVLNGICFSAVLLLFWSVFFAEHYSGLFSVVALFCMVFSIILKPYSDWKFAPAFYAMYGFVALSVAIYGWIRLPNTFLLLSLQSFYVVTIAVWFRSKMLATMNSLLFIALLASYLAVSDSVNSINYTFAGTALATAYLINQMKTRLELNTGSLINLYLTAAFGMLLFALYKSVSSQYVTLSWTLAAIGYFLLSLLLKNRKYRWMALLTMLAAASYLFTVDLVSISPVYRIIAFLFLAVISLSVSVYYVKLNKSDGQDNDHVVE